MKRGIVAASITLCPNQRRDQSDFKNSIESIEVKYQTTQDTHINEDRKGEDIELGRTRSIS